MFNFLQIWWLADEAKQSGKLLTALASGKSTQRRHCKHCRTPIPPDQNIVEDSAELTAVHYAAGAHHLD